MAERFDRIWHNARLATVRGDLPDLGAIERGVIAARDGRIVFAGSRSDFPSDADAAERIDCAGRWITPGLVDCHTHLVFGGNRAHEFELRLQGASYEEIARAGRRHRLDGRGDAGIERGRTCCQRAAEARRTDRRGRDDAGDQIRLWARHGDRDAAAVGCAYAGPQPAGHHPHDVSWRARAASGS